MTQPSTAGLTSLEAAEFLFCQLGKGHALTLQQTLGPAFFMAFLVALVASFAASFFSFWTTSRVPLIGALNRFHFDGDW